MKNLIILALILLNTPLWSQQVDMARMNRNIEAAENIISSLMKGDHDSDNEFSFFGIAGRKQVEGTYLTGFGVLFTFTPSYGSPLLIHKTEKENGDKDVRIYLDGKVVIPDNKRNRRRPSRFQYEYEGDIDTIDLSKLFENVVQTFVKEYAYLLSQVPENEKIMLRMNRDRGGFRVSGIGRLSGDGERRAYSASIRKSDISTFQKGNMTEQRLYEKIEFSTPDDEEQNSNHKNLELLSNIFSDLYKSDMEGPLRLTGGVKYEKIEGLGAIYHLTIRPKYRGNGFRALSIDPEIIIKEELVYPDRGSGQSRDERKEEKEEQFLKDYPQFLEELKLNIVEYGSIVRELAKDEALIFKVEFCKGCDDNLPREIEITAKQSVLEGFRTNKLSLEQATSRLNVLETSE